MSVIMQVKIQNQNILITGASGGIGRSIVKNFDGDNNNLLIIGTNEKNQMLYLKN